MDNHLEIGHIPELVESILYWLNISDVLKCSLVCKYWDSISKKPTLPVWQTIHLSSNRRFPLSLLRKRGTLDKLKIFSYQHSYLKGSGSPTSQCEFNDYQTDLFSLKPFVYCTVLSITLLPDGPFSPIPLSQVVKTFPSLEILDIHPVQLSLTTEKFLEVEMASVVQFSKLQHLRHPAPLMSRAKTLFEKIPSLQTAVFSLIHFPKGPIDVYCAKCNTILFKNLTKYMLGPPSQPHLDCELYTDSAPTHTKIVGRGKMNCENNCHPGLWLIDSGSGIIRLQKFKFAMACGPTFVLFKQVDERK